MAMMHVVRFVLAAPVLCVSSTTASEHPSHTFAAFIQEHGRSYLEGSAEFTQRRNLFEQRVAEYERHNSNPHRLWTAGVSALTDRTSEELASLRGWNGFVTSKVGSSLRGTPRSVERHGLSLRQTSGSLPSNASWAHLESLQKVAQQGGCGSCWAHATALAMETNHEIKRGSFKMFSVQELVKCSPNPHHCGGSGGCDGSTAEVAMQYVMHQGLSDTPGCPAPELLQWQLNGEDWDSILLPGVHAVPEASPARQLGLVGWERLPENRAEPLMRAVVDWGPVAVSVAASPWSGYRKGVFNSCKPDVVIDHAVTLIGFGRAEGLGVNFWNIRNSWGKGWGEHGDIRLVRGNSDEELCGVDARPDLGTGCDGGPTRVVVCGMCGILYDTVVPHFSA